MSEPPTTFARLMTPPGRGGIAVIALAGPATRRILDQCFRPRAAHTRGHAVAAPGQLQLGEILDGSDVIDEAILTHTPRGAEINIHGGPAATRRVLGRLADLGAQLETDRPTSLLNPAHPRWHNPAVGEELLAALPAAPSLFAATCLASQWSAGLSQLARETLDALSTNLSPSGGDDPQGPEGARPHRLASSPPPPKGEELKILAQRLRQAAGRLATMQKLLNPPEVVLAGPPNAGKSTLANALVARPVSIVHAMAGTTRDWIREQAVIDGRAVWLTDTAGLWDVDHAVDAEAVRRAWDRIDSADLVLLCNPADAPPENSASNTMHALHSPRPIHAPTLAVTTKADLLSNGARRSTRSAATTRGAAGATPRPDQNRNDNDPSIHNSELITHNLSVSAETGEGLPALRTAILEKLGLADIDPAAPAAFTQRQADLLNHAADALDIENHEIVISSLSQVLF